MSPPLHLVGLVEVDGEFFACGRGFEGPGRLVGDYRVGEVTLLLSILASRFETWERIHTSMKGSCPFTEAKSFDFVNLTFKSRPFRFPGIEMVMSTSLIVCVHVYGRAACSATSFAFASASSFFCSSGGGDPVIVVFCCYLQQILELLKWSYSFPEAGHGGATCGVRRPPFSLTFFQVPAIILLHILQFEDIYPCPDSTHILTSIILLQVLMIVSLLRKQPFKEAQRSKSQKILKDR